MLGRALAGEVGKQIGGVLGGTLAGMGIGALFGGPIGAQIGAAVGFLLGALPNFDEGGIIPGPIGAAQLAIVHGGELVIPAPIASSIGVQSAPEVIDNHIYIDGREIYRSMQRIARDQDARMTGSSIGGRHWRVA